MIGNIVSLGEMTLEKAAHLAAGNWREFRSFTWDRIRDLRDPESWAIIYTHDRDSDLLATSNAVAIEQALGPFAGSDADTPDVVFESHSHWAVGHVDGFSIRVYRKGEVTEAFVAFHAIAERLAAYPILDADDYERLESEATLENIAEAARPLRDTYDLPADWAESTFSWLGENRPSAIENRDDRGGYPGVDDLQAAFGALRFRLRVEPTT